MASRSEANAANPMLAVSRPKRGEFRSVVPSERVVIAATWARLFLAWSCAIAVWRSEALVALALLAVLVGADVVDGIVARKLDVDSNLRRGTDAVIDRLSVHIVFLAFVLVHPVWIVPWLALLTRDVYQGALSFRSLHHHGVLLIGDRWHKGSSISDAVWGACLLVAPAYVAAIVGVGALTINWLLLFDYLGSAMTQPKRRAERCSIERRYVADLEGLEALRSALRALTSRRPVRVR